ncbi:uncharacterized protein LOC111341799 [Stylophora pistillata]|uniref:uncharacterized protein LOC111341799 n=1 Tax=Stylophora pistillata TaxID=50429 RepID=UPI000C04B28F|nr:uncharacterized protein LOC111341799 [Stylophora pistillata]
MSRNSPGRRNGGNQSSDSLEESSAESILGTKLNLKSNGYSSGKIVGFPPITEELDKKGSTPCISFMDEDLMIDRTKKMPEHIKQRWRRAAIWVTVFCIVVSFSITIASFQAAGAYDSSSALALAFDCANASLCSLVVLWRFKTAKNGSLGYKREKVSCLVFATSFIVSGTLTAGLSIKRIVEKDHPSKTFCIVVVLSVGCLLYTMLAVMQCYVSKKLLSSAMLGSCIDSALSAALMFGLIISNCTFLLVHTDLWYLDHSMAILVAIVSVLCGVQILVEILYYKKLPIDLMPCKECY